MLVLATDSGGIGGIADMEYREPVGSARVLLLYEHAGAARYIGIADMDLCGAGGSQADAYFTISA
jgi:hypothetical protein